MFAPRVARNTPHRCHQEHATRELGPGTKVQARLAIGPVGDPLEAEADRVAEQVLHSPEPARRPEAGTLSQPRHQLAAATEPSAGRPLDPGMRAFLEPRFGFDFSRVRIFSDEKAAESAQSIGALAYTVGTNIVFGGGRYRPGTGEGRRLLAHELTHVVQQGTGRTIPSIQRDTPKGQETIPPGATSQGGPLSTTKRYETDLVSRLEVKQALTDFLYQVQAAQGTQTLHVTEPVRFAVRKLFAGDATGSAQIEGFLARTVLPGSAPEFADAVTKLLPASVPRARVAHLGTLSPKDAPDTRPKSVGEAAGHVVVDSTVAPIVKKLPIPKSWQDKIIDGARGAVADGIVGLVDQAMSGAPMSDQAKGAIHSAVEAAIQQKGGTPMDRQQEGAGSPYAPVQPPWVSPPLGSVRVPGEHIFNLPKIKWDFPTREIPKPNLPQPPAASDAKAVDKIIQGLDDNSLIPAAAKGKPEAANFASARDLATDLANRLAAADKKKQYTVELTISMSYRHVEDLAEIFDKISAIVRQIAAALPGGAANVGEVIISPARAGKGDTIPARRIVKLHGGN